MAGMFGGVNVWQIAELKVEQLARKVWRMERSGHKDIKYRQN